MLTQKTIEWINFYVKPEFSEEEFNKAVEALNCFLAVKNTERAFEEAINVMSESSDLEKRFYLKNFTDLEIFMKSLHHLLHDDDPAPSPYNDETSFAEYLKYVFHKVPHVQGYLKDLDPDNYKENKQNHYLIVYQYRNPETHDSQYTIDDIQKLTDVIRSTLVCYLDLSLEYRDSIIKAYKNMKRRELVDFAAKSKKIVADYEATGFRYFDLQWSNSSDNKSYTVYEIITSGKRQIKLLGSAGSGKTTALRRIEYVLAKKYVSGAKKLYPLYIALSDIQFSNDSVTDIVAARLNITNEQAEDFLDNGDICLLLDGYNEILSNNIKKRFAGEVDALERKEKLPMILTDRAVSKNEIRVFSRAEELHLYELTLEMKLNYLLNNCNDENIINLIKQEAAENPITFAELDKPIMLDHFLEAVKSTGQIPVYLNFTYLKMLFEREQDEKRDESIADLKRYLEALSLLADEKFTQTDALRMMKKVDDIFGSTGGKFSNYLALAINMGVLEMKDDMISFMNNDYRQYFLMWAEKNKLDTYFAEV